MPVTIRKVEGAKDIDRFLEVPFDLYRDDPNWIAPLFLERHEHLSPKRNPYFKHAEVQLFLATRGERPVGRISAQIDRLRLERYGDATGQFGFLEAPDDPEVFAALFDTAAEWLKARGMRRMQGPFSFSINEETGLLVDGFNAPPRLMMGHALPYAGPRVEEQGFIKAMDVFAYDYDARPLPRAMAAMVSRAEASGDLDVRPLSKKNLKRDLALIVSIFNDAWSSNWGFVPWTNEEIEALGNNLKLLVGEDYVAIASWKGVPAAMAVSLPDINLAIRDLKGRLLPLGWAKLLWRVFARPPRAVRLPLMGVLKEHQSTPVGAALALAVIDRIRAAHVARGTTRGELSWILEDNMPMRRMIEGLGGRPYKTYRIYERGL
ncbi:MAG: dATP pyrophosphohydrolase [Parvibaculaceae bacterium]